MMFRKRFTPYLLDTLPPSLYHPSTFRGTFNKTTTHLFDKNVWSTVTATAAQIENPMFAHFGLDPIFQTKNMPEFKFMTRFAFTFFNKNTKSTQLNKGFFPVLFFIPIDIYCAPRSR